MLWIVAMLAMFGQVDDYCFDSCGYSCNMHSGLSYDACMNWAWPCLTHPEVSSGYIYLATCSLSALHDRPIEIHRDYPGDGARDAAGLMFLRDRAAIYRMIYVDFQHLLSMFAPVVSFLQGHTRFAWSYLIMFDFQTGLLPTPRLPIVCMILYHSLLMIIV